MLVKSKAAKSGNASREVHDPHANARTMGRTKAGRTPWCRWHKPTIVVGQALSSVLAPIRRRRPTTGGLVAFMLYISIISGMAARLSDTMVQLQDGLAALERVGDMLRIRPNPEDAPGAKQHQLTGHVDITDLSFAYGDKNVLHDVSMRFERGKSYALVGPSGSGKSTLVQLLLRLYDPKGGSISVDGVDLRELQQPIPSAGRRRTARSIHFLPGSRKYQLRR